LFSINVLSTETDEKYPKLLIFIWVKVNGSIKTITEPKLDKSAITIEAMMIGIWKLLIFFNL
tara:strand:- start:295 stop:480 length:186 start_codon:yes stop_codon:yes gene_type:complete